MLVLYPFLAVLTFPFLAYGPLCLYYIPLLKLRRCSYPRGSVLNNHIDFRKIIVLSAWFISIKIKIRVFLVDELNVNNMTISIFVFNQTSNGGESVDPFTFTISRKG